MDWIERLNKAMNYIEEHLTDEMDYSQIAQIACCSTYHFQRMFAYMANVSLAEYIRRRRMTLAAVDLQAGGKVLDIGLKYGYSSPTAFNRAFQSIHGIAPSLVCDGVPVKAFRPISFLITIKGAEEMNYRIETKDPIRLVGISAPLPDNTEKGFEIVPQLWQKAVMEGTLPKLVAMMDSQPKGILGVSLCGDSDAWRYIIGVASTMDSGNELEEVIIPSYTWAVFPGDGPCPQAIQELERRIMLEWLPSSGYEYDLGPDVELYLNPEPQNAKFEVWIPVRKK